MEQVRATEGTLNTLNFNERIFVVDDACNVNAAEIMYPNLKDDFLQK